MRIDQLTPDLVRSAIALYLDQAWPEGSSGRPVLDLSRLEGAATTEDAMACFERPRADEEIACQRFTLRLGNWRYPFMKFVVQEYLVEGEYFFSVDTHDDLHVDASAPDHDAWTELRRANRTIKASIERAWSEAGLPTYDELEQLTEALAREEQPQARGARILVVDDEEQVARGLAALLGARGYQVEVAHNGRAVLERLAQDPLPDLVILDYAMPELDGWEVLERVRQDPRTADLRVLLATATDIELAMLQRCSALLKKPYPRELLFQMLDQLLA